MSAALTARSTGRTDGLDKTRALQRVLYRSAKAAPTRRFHALYGHVARSDVLWRAWEAVRANRGAPGVDGQSIADVEAAGVGLFLRGLAESLMAGTYKPSPLRRVHIPKPDGRTRPLGIPTVGDRVVMAAAKIVLEPIFEADFSPVSFGFRPKTVRDRRVRSRPPGGQPRQQLGARRGCVGLFRFHRSRRAHDPSRVTRQ